jgi:hypothetical protein
LYSFRFLSPRLPSCEQCASQYFIWQKSNHGYPVTIIRFANLFTSRRVCIPASPYYNRFVHLYADENWRSAKQRFTKIDIASFGHNRATVTDTLLEDLQAFLRRVIQLGPRLLTNSGHPAGNVVSLGVNFLSSFAFSRVWDWWNCRSSYALKIWLGLGQRWAKQVSWLCHLPRVGTGKCTRSS